MPTYLFLFFIICLPSGIMAGNLLENNKDLQQIENKYNLNLIADSFAGGDYAKNWAFWITPTDADSILFAEFMDVFADEWNKYPLSWIKVNGLRKIAFVKKLTVTGQERFAMPDPYDETLYYDIDYLRYGEDYVSEMIHHEFWHMIEEQHFGTMYYRSSTWQSFNRAGFQYGNGGSDAYTDGEYTDGEHTKLGFVTNYAMYGEEEDRAETYCWFFTTRTWTLLNEWISTDRLLKKKFNWMLNFMESKVPEMNFEYFEAVNKAKVSLPLNK